MSLDLGCTALSRSAKQNKSCPSLDSILFSWSLINNKKQLSLTKKELWCRQVVRPDVPFELFWLTFIARLTAVNLLNSMLANVACKPRSRFQSVNSLGHRVIISVWIPASLIGGAPAKSVAAELANLRQRNISNHRLLVFGQLCDIEGGQLLLQRNERLWLTPSDVNNHRYFSEREAA